MRSACKPMYLIFCRLKSIEHKYHLKLQFLHQKKRSPPLQKHKFLSFLLLLLLLILLLLLLLRLIKSMVT
jgi:hypothetical protein